LLSLQGRVLSDGPTAAMATDVLLLQVQTVEQSSSSSETN